jgi:hypothetical protein
VPERRKTFFIIFKKTFKKKSNKKIKKTKKLFEKTKNFSIKILKF